MMHVHFFQRAPVLVDFVDADQQTVDAVDAACAACDSLRLLGGVAVATVVDDRDPGTFEAIQGVLRAPVKTGEML
jgi:hypothetical protein